ncbi:hypothetical protein IAQ61_008464 [Plenodomus lingam]|uniref:uncharacterized protein n=1 Tax=Leptosphaeria maculans TaxID=5022 RepID=UPI0033219003|nr:hypothetical protein IAQ61_008464 [Plenodomus lingam]
MHSTSEAFARAVVRDPTSAEVGRYLTTRTGAQMAHLMRSIREPAAQAALTAALLAAPRIVPAVAGRSTVPEKNKKALNAFVGFRCYYIAIPMFKSIPMKLLSQPIGMIWEVDPNKSLWSLMAKAWSLIRDQIGKNNAPLDEFFAIVCPILNIPSRETYLEYHGWTLTIDKEGAPTLSRNDAFEVTPVRSQATETPLSVDDIINFAKAGGYALGYVADANTVSATFLSHQARERARGRRRMNRNNKQVIRALHAEATAAHIKNAKCAREPPEAVDSPFYHLMSDAMLDAMYLEHMQAEAHRAANASNNASNLVAANAAPANSIAISSVSNSVPEDFATEGFSPEEPVSEYFAPQDCVTEGFSPEHLASEGFSAGDFASEDLASEGFVPGDFNPDDFARNCDSVDSVPEDAIFSPYIDWNAEFLAGAGTNVTLSSCPHMPSF